MAPTVFYVHTQLRASTCAVFHLWFYSSPHFRINFPFLHRNISWFMGAMKVNNGRRVEPLSYRLSLVPDQNPLRSKLVAHFSLRDSLMNTLPVNIKVLFLPAAKAHKSIHICCFFFFFWSMSCMTIKSCSCAMYMRS